MSALLDQDIDDTMFPAWFSYRWGSLEGVCSFALILSKHLATLSRDIFFLVSGSLILIGKWNPGTVELLSRALVCLNHAVSMVHFC